MNLSVRVPDSLARVTDSTSGAAVTAATSAKKMLNLPIICSIFAIFKSKSRCGRGETYLTTGLGVSVEGNEKHKRLPLALVAQGCFPRSDRQRQSPVSGACARVRRDVGRWYL